jgi:hypothetical protein
MVPNCRPKDLNLPITEGPVRFAVGPPDGLTSNAWRFWSTKAGDVYIRCRDNFQEAKVSLHASGRWRMGFTTEALTKNPGLISGNENRAWDVWDNPPASLPETVVAFRLPFLSSELGVRPDQRDRKKWKDIVFVEAPPPGKMTVFTLFITERKAELMHSSEPSFTLASLQLGDGRYAELVVHGEPEGELPAVVASSVTLARKQAAEAGVQIPAGAYGYFLGQMPDGCRYIVGANVDPASASVPTTVSLFHP